MRKFLPIVFALQLFVIGAYAGTDKSTDNIKDVKILIDAVPFDMDNLQANFSIELQKAVVLTWKANSDYKNYTYTIERAAKDNFSEIGSLYSANTLDQDTFCFTDFKPLSGISYYRIKITDSNNQLKYSKVVKVDSIKAELAFTSSDSNIEGN